ncbi:MAG: M2 family metallopeptidase [Planctomycetes bacterium]|nr:M2 family metallopeptidase [Planctomycetota bacterium]
MDVEIERFLHDHVAQVKPLAREKAVSWWEHSTTGKEEAARRGAMLETAYQKMHSDPTSLKRLKGWLDSNRLGDPVQRRQVSLLYLDFLGNQKSPAEIEEQVNLEKEIEGIYNNFRGTFHGHKVSDNQIDQVLSTENDSAQRKAAWEASKQIGREVSERVLHLVRLRNATARRLGYRDHYAFGLALAEIDERELFVTLDKLRQLTDAPFTARKREMDEGIAKRFGLSPGDLRPWHYADPFFQRAPSDPAADLDRFYKEANLVDLTTATYDGLGMDIRDIVNRSDLFAREGKCQHAFCTHIDREGDVRVLCNIDPSERWMGTMLHEFGHAVYDKYLPQELPFLLRTPAHSLSTEAIAELFGHLAQDARWMSAVARISKSELEAARAHIQAHQRMAMVVFVRWGLVMTHFERDLYARPDADLNKLWWDYVERFQGVPRPDGRNEPDWAAKLHLALAPVYYQNYLLGNLMAAQLHEHLERKEGGLIGNPKAGAWLRQRVFAEGARREWNEGLRFATGEPLNPKYFVDRYVK